MHRRIVLGLMCLFTGFVVNIAVAAALGLRAIRSGPVTQSFGFTTKLGVQCNVQWNGDFGRDAIAMWSRQPDGQQAIELHDWRSNFQSVFAARGIDDPRTVPDFLVWRSRSFPQWLDWVFEPIGHDQMTIAYASGWPWRSTFGVATGPPSVVGAVGERGLFFREAVPSPRAFGWFLLPVGTALNTLLFSMPFLLVAWLAPIARTRRRLRRGHCPRCNYDLRHELSAGCSECGWNKSSATPADDLAAT